VSTSPGKSKGTADYVSAEHRHAFDRVLNRALWIIVCLLLAWFVVGFFREPAASSGERIAIGVIVVSFAAVIAIFSLYRKTLPALDRKSRTAIVTGRELFATNPDFDSSMPDYELVAVRVDLHGVATDTMIADIIAAESLDRFTLGSTWNVYAFEDPLALNNDPSPDGTRVILTEAHDDVIRTGYDLGRYTMHQGPGPGSDLLLRRFANDRPEEEGTTR